MVPLNQAVLLVDNRLIETGRPPARFLRKHGLEWFIKGENEDYLAPEMIQVSRDEARAFKEVTEAIYEKMLATARHIVQHQLWHQVGVPANAQKLVAWSMQHEQHLHLVGRFDFAGGLGKAPLKLLEFNADTCSLMPETVHVQAGQIDNLPRKLRKNAGQFNSLLPKLTKHFEQLIQGNPDKFPALLLSGLGHPEDWINLELIALAAKNAGFEEIMTVELERVIFSPDEGLFVEKGPDNFVRFDFWYKMVPWEFIAYEEPELMEMLTSIITNKLAIVINPAWTMLLQSKGLLPLLYEQNKNHPALLKTSLHQVDFPTGHFARKPIFGRTGDNVALFYQANRPFAENDGDYGDFPVIYQALAQFDKDEDGDIYQPSVFWSGDASALCFRRQDDHIVDDDAEFVSHFIEP
ncbi:MAG: glutathionylspermidine synthase [Saprospiraceae bacterium]|nr:MAG: glutathionylspermidine synthase [Saprospiraceae bacterium]